MFVHNLQDLNEINKKFTQVLLLFFSKLRDCKNFFFFHEKLVTSKNLSVSVLVQIIKKSIE